MKILMVTSETVPFAKTGGLADAVSALAINLRKQGHDVRIVMPRYYKIDRSKLKPIEAPLAVAAGTIETWVKVLKHLFQVLMFLFILLTTNRVLAATVFTEQRLSQTSTITHTVLRFCATVPSSSVVCLAGILISCMLTTGSAALFLFY